MSQLHSTSKSGSQRLPARAATRRLRGIPKWFVAHVMNTANDVVALFINTKLMTWLALDANGR